ncbi:MAG: aspartate dehydrogenase [Clostridia bacterium]|nr:aspartate dehydrogenase [Clostridia bacterium]
MIRLFSKKRPPAPERGFDPEAEKPVVRASVCTGEKVAGFRDLRTGRFREVMLIRDRKDLDAFMKEYGLDMVPTEY